MTDPNPSRHHFATKPGRPKASPALAKGPLLFTATSDHELLAIRHVMELNLIFESQWMYLVCQGEKAMDARANASSHGAHVSYYGELA